MQKQQQQPNQQQPEAPLRGAAFNRQKRRQVRRCLPEEHQHPALPAQSASFYEAPLSVEFCAPTPEEAVSLPSSKEEVVTAPQFSAGDEKQKFTSYSERHAVLGPSVTGGYSKASAVEAPSPHLLQPSKLPAVPANPQVASQCGEKQQDAREPQGESSVGVLKDLKEGNSQRGRHDDDSKKRNEPPKSIYAVLAGLDC